MTFRTNGWCRRRRPRGLRAAGGEDAVPIAAASDGARIADPDAPAARAAAERRGAATRHLDQWDMAMGHSVGEYGALVAAGAMSFKHSMAAVSSRGREMASLEMEDNGMMAAALAPLAEVERIVAGGESWR